MWTSDLLGWLTLVVWVVMVSMGPIKITIKPDSPTTMMHIVGSTHQVRQHTSSTKTIYSMPWHWKVKKHVCELRGFMNRDNGEERT